MELFISIFDPVGNDQMNEHFTSVLQVQSSNPLSIAIAIVACTKKTHVSLGYKNGQNIRPFVTNKEA